MKKAAKSPRLVTVVPARAGSKRVANKNIQLIGNHSLMGWALLAADTILNIPCIVSTDSTLIGTMAKDYGAAVHYRSAWAAADDAGDLEVIQDMSLNAYYDGVIYLRPTTPFRDPKIIDDAIEQTLQRWDKIDSMRSIEVLPETSWKTFEITEEGWLRPICGDMKKANLPNQGLPVTYKGNGYIDIIKLETARAGYLFGPNCWGYKTPRTMEIDDEEDLRLARLRFALDGETYAPLGALECRNHIDTRGLK